MSLACRLSEQTGVSSLPRVNEKQVDSVFVPFHDESDSGASPVCFTSTHPLRPSSKESCTYPKPVVLLVTSITQNPST